MKHIQGTYQINRIVIVNMSMTTTHLKEISHLKCESDSFDDTKKNPLETVKFAL